jgi:hypothetical protein
VHALFASDASSGRSDAAEEKLAQTSSYLQDCLSKQLFIEKHKVTGQNVDIYTFQILEKNHNPPGS